MSTVPLNPRLSSSPPSSFPKPRPIFTPKHSRPRTGSHGSSVSASELFDLDNGRHIETAIERSNRKQHGPAFKSVTIELPITETCHLETTILSPETLNEPSNPLVRSGNKLAVLLHPWSKAGGNAEDPVLRSLVTTFLERDYHVMIYSSRGVGNSTGRASYTGLIEARDLQEVVKWALKEINAIEDIVLLGYSYGSLAASMHPPYLQFSSDISPDLRIRHIILSYPLSVLWIVTFFHTTPFTRALKNLVTHPKSDVLIIYGENDQFTKATKYRGWVGTLGNVPGKAEYGGQVTDGGTGKMSIVSHQNGDHFWRGPIMRELRKSIATWLDQPRPTNSRTSTSSPGHKAG